MKHWYKIFFFCLLAFGAYQNTMAQFTYSGLRLSYHNVRFDRISEYEVTSLNNFSMNLDLVHRLHRNFALGISSRFPITNSFGYTFQYNDQFGGDYVSGSGDFEGGTSSLNGEEFKYYIEHTFSFTIMARAYFDVEKNIYLGLRYTIERYDESFSFGTGASSVRSFEEATARGIGFGFGYMPKIDDHWYFTYAFNVDLLSVDTPTFNQTATTDDGFGNTRSYRFQSKIDDDITAYELSIGIGYTF